MNCVAGGGAHLGTDRDRGRGARRLHRRGKPLAIPCLPGRPVPHPRLPRRDVRWPGLNGAESAAVLQLSNLWQYIDHYSTVAVSLGELPFSILAIGGALLRRLAAWPRNQAAARARRGVPAGGSRLPCPTATPELGAFATGIRLR